MCVYVCVCVCMCVYVCVCVCVFQIMAVEPGSQRYVSEGTRVCAYWSQQFRCLYPGTVAKSRSLFHHRQTAVLDS